MLVEMKSNPIATAQIRGRAGYESIRGKLNIYETYGGSIVVAEVYGIPKDVEDECSGFHGFHIHEGAHCTGNASDPFADTGGHYNPKKEPHPCHAGDLPPLLSNDGIAWTAVYTNRFHPEEVIGKTIIIHDKPDDFHTQPSGNSGSKIACGEIVPWEKDSDFA